MTGFETSYTQPGAPLPPGASPPAHGVVPVIVPVGARRRESGYGQPGMLNTVSTPWFDPNQQQQYYPQQPWANADPFSYSNSGPSGQYGMGVAAGWADPATISSQRPQSMAHSYNPNDPFATPAGHQDQYTLNSRDSKASYFDPRASGADHPIANAGVVAPGPSAARPTSDDKAHLIALNDSRTNSTSPTMTTYLASTPGHKPSPSLPSIGPEASSSTPQPTAGPATTNATSTSGSPAIRPMSTTEVSSAAGDPFNNESSNPDAEGQQSDEPPPPSYAEAERARSMDSSMSR